MKKQTDLLALSLVLIALSVSACTKSRTAKLPDDLAKELFTRQELESAQIKIETQDAPQVLSESEKMKAIHEKQPFKVKSVTSPKRLKFMFKDLALSGLSKGTVIRLKTTQDFVTAYKVVERSEDLGALESTLPMIKDRDGKALLPIFKYAIESYGIVKRQKNDMGEKTSNLELENVDWSKATHVKFSTTMASRNLISFPSSSEDELQEIYLLEKLDGQIMTAKDLKSNLRLNTFKLPIQDENARVLLRVSGNQLVIFQITNKTSELLTDKEKSDIRNNKFNNSLMECPDTINTQVSELNKSNCVLSARGEVEIEYVHATLNKTASGKDFSSEISFKSSQHFETTRLIRISAGKSIDAVNSPTDLNGAVEISALKGKEFYFRRTIEDAANTLFIPPGMSGETVLVDFTFSSGSVKLRRLESLLATGFNKPIDREELLTVPAQYFKLKKTDERGRPLTKAILERTDYKLAELVKLDWNSAAQNATSGSNSPLFSVIYSGCISGFNSINIPVGQTDDRLDTDGVLNFSLDYNFNVRPECASSYLAKSGYALDEAIQINSKIKERFSLKLNDKKSDDGNQKLPYQAQKALGFGGFTISNRVYDQFGNYGKLGTENSFPMVFDFKKGKVTYILGGVSRSNPRRNQIIESTRKVISDINVAINSALRGSDLFTGENLVELKIDGEDIEAGQLGDLDRNYIWYEERVLESGPLGVAQPAPNPRSGFIIAANVIIYGGALNNQLGYFNDRKSLNAELETFKNDLIASTKEELAKEEIQMAEQLVKDKRKAELISNIEKYEKKSSAHLSLKEKLFTPDGQENISKLTETKKINFGLSLLKKISHSKKIQTINGSKYSIKTGLKNSTKMASQFKNKKRTLTSPFNGKASTLISEIYEIATKEKAFNDTRALEIITLETMLKYNKNSLSKENGNALAKKLIKLKMAKQVRDGLLAKGPSCIKDADSLLNGSAVDSIDKLFSNSYEATLAHEIGHSIGLTHNFIASADPINFDGKEYSSVMDYMDESTFQYEGLGLYDVHALRALYTGRIENGAGELVTIKEVYANTLGENLEKINHLSDAEIGALDVKRYKYCNDYEVGSEPLCARFDRGTTAHEAVKNAIADREAFYLSANGIRNRIEYDVFGANAYIGAVMGDLQNIRSYLDGFLFSIFTESPEEVRTDYLMASFEAYQYLNAVIRTPEADLAAGDMNRYGVTLQIFPEPSALDEDGNKKLAEDFAAELAVYNTRVTQLGNRFLKIKFPDENGNIKEIGAALVIYEKRSTYDRYLSSKDYRINTRGYEYDKAIASLMLAARSSPGAQFERSGFPISFIEFEGFIMQARGVNNPTANLIKDIMSSTVSPAAYDSVLGLVHLDASTNSTEVSSLQKGLASDLAIFSLAPTSMDGISEVNNYLFRIGNKEGFTPKGLLGVTRLQEGRNSSTGIHYYQTDGAHLTNNMISDLYKKRFLLEEKPTKSLPGIGMAADEFIGLYAELTSKGMDTSILEQDLVAVAKSMPNLSERLKKINQQIDRLAPAIGTFLRQAGYDKETQNQARSITESTVKIAAAYRISFSESVYQVVTAESAAGRVFANSKSSQEQKQQAIQELNKAKESLEELKNLTISISEEQSYLTIGFMAAAEKITEENMNKLTTLNLDKERNSILKNLGARALEAEFKSMYGKQMPNPETDLIGYITYLMQLEQFKTDRLAQTMDSLIAGSNPKLAPSQKPETDQTEVEKNHESEKQELRNIIALEQSVVLQDAALTELGRAIMKASDIQSLDNYLTAKGEAVNIRTFELIERLPEFADASELLKGRWNDSFETVQLLSQKYQLSSIEAAK